MFKLNLNFLNRKYCPFCKKWKFFKPFGINPRKNAMCPICYSLERHRMVYHLYNKYFLRTKKDVSVLHLAPEKCIYNVIKKNRHITYQAIDLCPSKYKFADCIKEDATDMSFKDNSFDFILTNHMMEHVPDDDVFIKELLRVLKPGGKIFLTVPLFYNLEKTFEDPNIKTDEDRLKYYGQEDHLRKYGRDLIKRLEKDYNAEALKSFEYINKLIMNFSSITNTYTFIITKT